MTLEKLVKMQQMHGDPDQYTSPDEREQKPDHDSEYWPSRVNGF